MKLSATEETSIPTKMTINDAYSSELVTRKKGRCESTLVKTNPRITRWKEAFFIHKLATGGDNLIGYWIILQDLQTYRNPGSATMAKKGIANFTMWRDLHTFYRILLETFPAATTAIFTTIFIYTLQITFNI